MRPGQLPNIRNDVMAELLARIAAGTPATTVCKQPDMPTYHTLRSWLRRYPTFAEALAEAQRVGLERRKWGFDEVRAEAFLARLRAGEGVRQILDQRGSPMSVAVYKHWLLSEAPFGEEVRRLIAERRRRTVRRVRMAFD